MSMEQNNNAQSVVNELYRWEALEFGESSERTPSWYLGVGFVLLAFVAYSIYQGEWIRVGVAVMIAVVLVLMLRMKPRTFSHALTEEGMLVGGKVYSYGKYKAFGIVRGMEGSRMVVIPTQRLSPGLSLQLGGADVEKIRAIMTRFLPEQEMDEDVVDRMNRWFRF